LRKPIIHEFRAAPLEAHAAFLFVLIARHPDVTLGEIVAAMHE
jgi:hypothetical protein